MGGKRDILDVAETEIGYSVHDATDSPHGLHEEAFFDMKILFALKSAALREGRGILAGRAVSGAGLAVSQVLGMQCKTLCIAEPGFRLVCMPRLFLVPLFYFILFLYF